jgi:hypothetical protein
MWEVAGFNFSYIPPFQLFPEQSKNLVENYMEKKLMIKLGTEMS